MYNVVANERLFDISVGSSFEPTTAVQAVTAPPHGHLAPLPHTSAVAHRRTSP